MKSFHTRLLSILLTGTCLLQCQNSSLSDMYGEEAAVIQMAIVSKLGPTSVTITWKCSEKTNGYLISSMGIFPTLFSSKLHVMNLGGLTSQTNYEAIATCGKPDPSLGIPVTFRTWVSSTPEKTQGIWVVGGIGSDGSPVSQIDLYDASSDTWYPAVTSVPTPRAFASILSHKNKIYVIGGLTESSSVYSTSLKVEVYDPYQDTWTTKSDLPQAVHGAVAGSVGDEIYLVSGSGTTSIPTSPLYNTVLKFYPDIGSSGQWLSYSSSSTIFPRTDMAGCQIDGVIYYSGGRLSSNGTLSSGTDGFIPTANTVTGISEPSINTSRFGAAGVCVNPEPEDLYPSDNQWFSVIGGSTSSGETEQPITSLISSAKTDFHQPGSTSFDSGPDLPQAIYFPGAQISYETRKIYVFGGANTLNIPLDIMYSIDSADPANSSWTTLSSTMPRARFGHKAIRIDR
ncbi:Kelch repeat-containing protein [Leptospira licerasiae]|uniref:Kelch repeat-containing protein n=1 Tax=Leptospira licerasiae TaxID=447106 RepID=UPI003015E598